jgi:hypothetical protein
MVQVWWLVCAASSGWWGENYKTELPVVALPLSSDGALFSSWESEDVAGEVEHPPNCEWWNGTYYYDLGMCSHMSVTRLPAHYAQLALQRATRCALHGTTDCVLSGEIGLNMPAAFVYDENHGMRMILAPKMLDVPESESKTVRLQDPNGAHPNQLFDFRDLVRVEYLKAASRTMETFELRGNDAYCVQALRRSVVPTCWDALD